MCGQFLVFEDPTLEYANLNAQKSIGASHE